MKSPATLPLSPPPLRFGGAALILVLAVAGAGAGACSSDQRETSDESADAEVTEGGAEDGSADAVQCEPGELLRCSEENTPSVVQCQRDGTGTEPATCPSSHVCREGECVKVDCIPGEGRCDGETPEVCDEAGETYIRKETCSGGESCENGTCLNRCEIAAERDSYIGCEYWAVELENHLLYEERESGASIPPDEMPPFAVVLANTSSSYDAEVTVLKGEGEPAEAIGSRTVGSDIPLGGETKTTVESELVKADGTVLLDTIDKPLVDVPLPEQSLLTLMLPNRKIPNGETTVREFAYRIRSTEPIVAYQFNPYCCNYNYTNDASLLLPQSALTGNYMYLGYPTWDAPSRAEGDDPESAAISVVATEPETEVTVQLREPTKQGLDYSDVIYPIDGDRLSTPDDQGRMTVTLQPHEVLNIAGGRPGVDLTGARVTADKPVSTFGAHSCAYVPFTKPACDHLEQQLFPMETWGQRFTATPLKRRGPSDEFTREATYWKFVARKDGTEIETGLDLRAGPDGILPEAGEGVESCESLSPEPSEGVIELDAGETCEFGTRQTFVAEANRPVLLGAFLSGQNSVGEDVSHAGDPAYFLVPPQGQYRREYSFLTPTTYHVNYVTVTIPSGFEELRLDGETIDLTSYESYEAYPDLGVARVHIEIGEGPHTMSSDTIPFGIVAYGYDDYVSYAYTGGLNLTKRQEVDQ